MKFSAYTLMGVNLLTVVVSLLIGGIIACHTICGSTSLHSNKKEGFITGAPLNYQLGHGVPNDMWSAPPVTANQAHQNMYAKLASNVGGQVPPKGLFMWADNLFKPECCFTPQQYSSSTGCACISKEQMQYISSRGGNNTLP